MTRRTSKGDEDEVRGETYGRERNTVKEMRRHGEEEEGKDKRAEARGM